MTTNHRWTTDRRTEKGITKDPVEQMYLQFQVTLVICWFLQDKYKVDPMYKYLFTNSSAFSLSYISKTAKFCQALSKLDSYALHYL